MNRSERILSLIDEATGLDQLKTDFAGLVKDAGFTDQETSKIVKAAPKFIKGEEGFTDFLKDADLDAYAKSRLGRHMDKMKKLSYYMAKLKHDI